MTRKTFTTLEEFIEQAKAGDTFTDAGKEGLTIATFHAKASRSKRGTLPVQRVLTDLMGRGNMDYAYRTRLTEGNLFYIRDTFGDPAFLPTQDKVFTLSILEITRSDYSEARFMGHHTTADHRRASLLAKAIEAPATPAQMRRPQLATA